MGELISFNEICQKVSFPQVLDWLNIPYEETQKHEIKGEGFIATHKNGIWWYFNPTGTDKGSIINFVATRNQIYLRMAAKLIKDEILTEKKETKKPIPTLTLEYHKFLEDLGIPKDICEGFNVGYCAQKSIMNGRVCFKVGEHYVGYSPTKNDWLFPKGFKRDTIWNIENCKGEVIFVCRDLINALMVLALGYANVVSIMGANPTIEQQEILGKYNFVFIC